MESEIKIFYISSTTRAGSTLLDMYLGNRTSVMSMGEINKITKRTIFQEYCSCKKRIDECDFWSTVIHEWNQIRHYSYEDYVRFKNIFERRKGIPRLLLNLFWPGKEFLNYCNDTKKLYELTAKYAEADVLVDSSKVPQRILILRKIFKNN